MPPISMLGRTRAIESGMRPPDREAIPAAARHRWLAGVGRRAGVSAAGVGRIRPLRCAAAPGAARAGRRASRVFGRCGLRGGDGVADECDRGDPRGAQRGEQPVAGGARAAGLVGAGSGVRRWRRRHARPREEQDGRAGGTVAALALVPAAAAAGIALLSDAPRRALGGLLLLGMNMALVIAMGIAVLVVLDAHAQRQQATGGGAQPAGGPDVVCHATADRARPRRCDHRPTGADDRRRQDRQRPAVKTANDGHRMSGWRRRSATNAPLRLGTQPGRASARARPERAMPILR